MQDERHKRGRCWCSNFGLVLEEKQINIPNLLGWNSCWSGNGLLALWLEGVFAFFGKLEGPRPVFLSVCRSRSRRRRQASYNRMNSFTLWLQRHTQLCRHRHSTKSEVSLPYMLGLRHMLFLLPAIAYLLPFFLLFRTSTHETRFFSFGRLLNSGLAGEDVAKSKRKKAIDRPTS